MTSFVRTSRLTVAGLHFIALSLLGLHFYVRALPPTPTPLPAAGSAEAAWWGFWPATYLPAWAIILGALLVMLPIAWFWLTERTPFEIRTWRLGSSEPKVEYAAHSPQHGLWLLVVSGLLVVAFFAFPIVHTRWGDALLISKALAWPDPAQRLVYSWQAPLDVFLHSQVWRYGHAWLGWKNAIAVYRLLSPLAGVLYLGVVLALAPNLPLVPAWLTFGLLVSLGLIQLFFGYIENYSLMTVGVLAYLWLALAALQGKKPLWCAATVLAITHATHPSTVILAPSLLYVGWQISEPGALRNQSLRRNVLQIALPMLIVAGATSLLMELGGHGLRALLTTDQPGGGDGSFFVPLWTISTRWQHYTMFSWGHLRDFFNEQMLVAPVVLPSLLWLSLRARQKANVATAPDVRFLLSAALAYLLFTWVWNADYGGQRDWDLFSPAVLPATCLLLVLLPRLLPDPRTLGAGVIPLLMVQCLHTTAWIYQNTLPWHWPK